jgi:hypothetical protein
MLTPNHIDMIVGFTIRFFNVEADLLKDAYEGFKRDILNRETGYICAPLPIEINSDMSALILLEFKRNKDGEFFFVVSDSEDMEELMKEWQIKISKMYNSYLCKFSFKRLNPGTLGSYLEKAKEIFAPHKQFSPVN